MAKENDGENVRDYAKDWLKGVHVAHSATNNNKIEIDSEFFFERATAVAAEWGKKKVSTIYPAVTATDIPEKQIAVVEATQHSPASWHRHWRRHRTETPRR